MLKLKTLGLFAGLLICLTSFAQPSEAELRAKVMAYYKNPGDITSLKFDRAKLEKRWEKGGWKYYWSRGYDLKLKTEYPNIYILSYGGVQYRKNGSSYAYSNMLTGGRYGYEGIKNPNKEAINAHLKATYDPLSFYDSYMMNYLIDAPNTIKLAEDPNWKWINLNEVSCDVVVTLTKKVNDIGNVEEQEGLYRITLQRSTDGKTYNKDATLLTNGKWLPLGKGSKKKFKTIRKFSMTKEELNAKKTLAQKNQVRHAEEFKKSLAVVDIPKFKSGNHVMQFTHELLLEGDEDKITAFIYQMLTPFCFVEWSDIVLTPNGERILAEATEDLENYKKAFCQYPEIKEISGTNVAFYDRSKYRFARISVTYENDRWYIYDIGYTIRKDDFIKHNQSGDIYCDGDPIFIDGEAQFKAGDKVMVLVRGTWFNGEILKPEMEKGGYSVKYGRSGLKEWVFASSVKEDPENKPKEEHAIYKVKYEIGETVSVKYTNVWYTGKVLKFSYEKEGYLVDIPDRNIKTWTVVEDMKKLAGKKEEKEKKSTNSKPKRKIQAPKKIRLRFP